MTTGNIADRIQPHLGLLGKNTAIVVPSNAPAAIIRSAQILQPKMGDLIQLCSGADDDVETQAALDALPATGGNVVLLAGDFVFGDTVSRAIDNVTIEGIGKATSITNDGGTPLFSAGVQDGWLFKNMAVDAGGINVAAATNWAELMIWIAGNLLLFDSALITTTIAGYVGINDHTPDSTLEVGGSFGVDGYVSTTTTPYTLGATNYFLAVDASGGNKVVNLPACAGIAGRMYVIKKVDASVNTVTIDGNGAETIDGNLTYTLSNQYDSVQLYCSGTAWYASVPASSGEIRTASGALTAGNANAFAFAWQNPLAVQIFIIELMVDITTAGGTAGSILDCGSAADATTHGDDLIDDANLNSTDVHVSTARVKLSANGGATDWVTGQILTQNAASLVGKYYIKYMEV